MAVGNHTLPTEILDTCNGFIYCFGEWANVVTDGTFWTFMLLAFVIAIFMATTRLGNKKAFGFASFTAITGSLWLGTLKFMPWWIVSAFSIFGIVGLVIMIMDER